MPSEHASDRATAPGLISGKPFETFDVDFEQLGSNIKIFKIFRENNSFLS